MSFLYWATGTDPDHVNVGGVILVLLIGLFVFVRALMR